MQSGFSHWETPKNKTKTNIPNLKEMSHFICINYRRKMPYFANKLIGTIKDFENTRRGKDHIVAAMPNAATVVEEAVLKVLVALGGTTASH